MLLADTFGYVDYKNVIKWSLKNTLLCLVFVDPVTLVKDCVAEFFKN